LHHQRQRRLVDARAVAVLHAQREHRRTFILGERFEREAPPLVDRRGGDDRGGRIAQFDTRLRDTFDAAACAPCIAGAHAARCVEFDQATRKRRFIERADQAACGIQVARWQAGADDAQAASVGMATQCGREIRRALDRAPRLDTRQRDDIARRMQCGQLRRRRAWREDDEFTGTEAFLHRGRKQAQPKQRADDELQRDARATRWAPVTSTAHGAECERSGEYESGPCGSIHRGCSAALDARKASR
jgi:hypothetical protein